MYEDLRCGDCIAICKFVTAHILYANAMTGYIFLTTLDKYEVCSDQTTEKKQLSSTFEDAAKHQNSASSESRGCWAVALLVTDLTDAHNRQTGNTGAWGMLAEPALSLNYQTARCFLDYKASLTIVLLQSPQSSLGKI